MRSTLCIVPKKSHHLCCPSSQDSFHSLSVQFLLGASGVNALSGKRRVCAVVKSTCNYRTGFPETKGLAPGPYRGDDPAIFIIIDTNNAGDRLEVSRGKQLLGMPWQEDTINYARDDLEGLKKHWLLRRKARSLTVLILGYVSHSSLSHLRMVAPSLRGPTVDLPYSGCWVMRGGMKAVSRGVEGSLG